MSKKYFNKKSAAKEVKEYDEEVIEIRRVTRVVKGGRRLRFRATVVIGNRNGKVGIGVGKSTEVTGAIQKAISRAKKDITTVILDNQTIPHDLKIKYKSSKLILMPASPGTGLIAGGTVRKVLELAGVKNILSKTIGSSNKISNTYATFAALKKLSATPRMKARSEAKRQMTEHENKKKIEAKEQKPKKPTEKPSTDKPQSKPKNNNQEKK